MSVLMKEICDSCQKFINIGQCITECEKCLKIIHTSCFKKSKFLKGNGKYYCQACYPSIVLRYNPFKKIVEDAEDDSDKSFNQNLFDISEELKEASEILENCGNYSASEVIPLLTKKICHFNTYFYNIDGNNTNFDTFVAETHKFKDNLSVIGLVETNINNEQKELYKIDNFKSFYNDKLDNKKSGTGVAIYINETLNATKNNMATTTLPYIESLFLKITKGTQKANVGVIYRPPNSSLKDFLDEIQKIIKSLPKTITYVMGDFNINLHKSDSDSAISEFEELFISEGLFPVISLATHTHLSTGTKTCIDNIFTNKIELIENSGVMDNLGKGHSHIFTTSTYNFDSKKNKKEKTTQYYSFSCKNTDRLVEKLEENQLSLINNTITNSPNSTIPNFSDFITNFKNYLDETCKLEVPRKTVRNAINNPWITESIITSVERKAELYDSWKSTCTKVDPHGDRTLHKMFSDYRRCLKHIINFEKSKLYKNKFEGASGNPKKTWEIINQLRGKLKKSMNPEFVIDNKRIYDRRTIANAFNKYFASIASKLNDEVKIKPLTGTKYSDFMPHRQANSMFLYDCNEEEIKQLIKSLENGKSSDIPVSVIKKCSNIISPILALQFNYLMEIGTFPDELKLGKISPIHKKENEELLKNYRPVSTLPIFGKIFEKIIYSRLYSYFTSKGILHDKQFGFRKHHSTSHALNYSIDTIKTSLRNGDHILGIFIDLSKAFDTIDHTILLDKLEHYGIRGRTLSLVTSYLSNRKQCVSALGELSDQLPIIYGVPQGSCLGPLLFLVYINDIANICNSSELILFADDTNIFIKGKTKKETYEAANRVLKLISSYMICNKLHINLEKSCYMYFSKPNLKNDNLEDTNTLQIWLDGNEIKQVTETKFLGITIDNNLSWEAHIKSLTKKLASCTGSINRIMQSIPEHLHRNIYSTLFESYLTYGISVWGGASNKKIEKLFYAQKKIVRVLFGDREKYLDKFKTCVRARPFGEQALTSEFYKKEHSKPLFNEHNILNLKNLYFYHISNETFKILKFRSPISIHDMYNGSKRNGKELFLITPAPNDSYLYKSCIAWNKTRNILRIDDSTVSISILKTRLRTYLLNQQSIGDADNWIEYNFVEI